jgi:hypothetical protein
MPSTNRAKPSPRKQENALDGFYGRSLRISAATSSSSTSTNATVENANRIGLNGDGGSRNVLTQEQIARCETNRLNALAIQERNDGMYNSSGTSLDDNGSGDSRQQQQQQPIVSAATAAVSTNSGMNQEGTDGSGFVPDQNTKRSKTKTSRSKRKLDEMSARIDPIIIIQAQEVRTCMCKC